MVRQKWVAVVVFRDSYPITLPLRTKGGMVTNSAGEPSASELRLARDEFAALLAQRTPEAIWQRFFAQNRFVLSRALPLRLLPCDIIPLGRPGSSEPDFLLYPGSSASARIHGVIELKTNYSKIVSRPRKTSLILSRDAATAVSQVAAYDALYDSFAPNKRMLALETISHLFVIMGQASELEAIEEALHSELRRIIPPDVRFVGFDELFKAYSRDLPKPVSLLYPEPLFAASLIDELLEGPREQVIAKPLHRIVSEKWDSFNFGGTQVREIEFERWHRDRFSRAPKFPHLFQPVGAPVLYAAEEFATALAELRASRDKVDDHIARLERVRFRHFEFRYSGRLLAIPPEKATDDLMNGHDYRPSMALASAALQQGLDGVIFPARHGRGRMLAIFRPDGIGELLSDRLLDPLSTLS
jgi:RES domain-containing protein